MTLPTSGSLSLSDVLAELRIANGGRNAPISLGDADVLALAGKSAPPISLSDLYGKSSYVAMSLAPHDDAGGNFSSSLSGGTAYAYPSVTVSGGTAPFTYAWSITSGIGTPTLSDASSASCTLARTYGKNSNGSFDVFLQCVVTDATGRTATASGIEAAASWGSTI